MSALQSALKVHCDGASTQPAAVLHLTCPDIQTPVRWLSNESMLLAVATSARGDEDKRDISWRRMRMLDGLRSCTQRPGVVACRRTAVATHPWPKQLVRQLADQQMIVIDMAMPYLRLVLKNSTAQCA